MYSALLTRTLCNFCKAFFSFGDSCNSLQVRHITELSSCELLAGVCGFVVCCAPSNCAYRHSNKPAAHFKGRGIRRNGDGVALIGTCCIRTGSR